MKDGQIVCKFQGATSNVCLANCDACRRYKPAKIKVIYVDLKGATPDGTIGYWYAPGSSSHTKEMIRIEIIVPIKEKK
jgi:hypothetical protein